MQNGNDGPYPIWVQIGIALGIPGTIALWARWSVNQAIDRRIDEKLKPLHETLGAVDKKCERILGRFDEMDRQ